MNISAPLFLLGIFILTSPCRSQNLVSNPDFETFSSCPTTSSQVAFATGWSTSSNSPDYFNSCNNTIVGVPDNICGFQPAASGNGYIGILCYGTFASNYGPNIREYANGTLSSPLIPGVAYGISFKVALMNMSSHAIDHIGAKFVMSYNPSLPISNTAHIFTSSVISDTMNWTTISGTFVADSAYNFIVIGNHFDDTITSINSFQPVTFGWNAYYFVDDVEVTQLSQLPVALFTAPNDICPGTCTNFTNLSVNATSYQWTFNGANPSSSTDPDPASICYNLPGNYDVQLIASNGNGSDTLLLSNYIHVYPAPLPQAIQQSGDTLFANAGATSYQWYYNGNLIAGATDSFYVAQASGDYNVIAADANGCEVEAAVFDVVANTQFEVGSGQLAIFPNPVVNKLAIGSRQFAIKAISIYNLPGDLVMAVFLPTDNYLQQIEVDVSQLLPGMYWLEFSSSEKTYRAKFIKQ